MSLIFNEYEKDIDSAKSSIEFISKIATIGTLDESEIFPISGTEAHSIISSFKQNYITYKIDQNIIRGGLVLYVVGRFETYVKDLVEDICIRLVKKAGSYKNLPKNLQNSLIIFTGQVIQSPRKYGHAERGVESFISVLSNNINEVVPFEKINTECITITDSNLRPDVLNELFVRIGAEKVIDNIAAQASMLTYFQTNQPPKAASELRSKLTKLMELRNQIAHPAPSLLTWPTKDDVVDYMNFVLLLGKLLDDVSDMYVSTLCN